MPSPESERSEATESSSSAPLDGAAEDSPPPAPTDAEDITAQEEAGAPASSQPFDKVAALVDERDRFRDLAMRSQAELENFRKQSIKRQTELIERAAESLIEQLLPVLDSFLLALDHDPDNETLHQLWGAFWGVLEREGLARIDETGAPFDPHLHEAVSHEPGEVGAQPVVAHVMRPGYRWRGRVIRAAMVSVRGD